MDFHYSPLQMVFDGWIVVALVVWAVVALMKLRGRRRVFMVAGLALWILATMLWMPVLLGWMMMSLAEALGPDLVWQLPTVPWLAGAVLVAVGVLLPVRPVNVAGGFPEPSGFPPPSGLTGWPPPPPGFQTPASGPHPPVDSP